MRFQRVHTCTHNQTQPSMASGVASFVALPTSLDIHISKGFISIFFTHISFCLFANKSVMILILQRRFIAVYLHYTLLQALNLPRLLRYCGTPQLVAKQTMNNFFFLCSQLLTRLFTVFHTEI